MKHRSLPILSKIVAIGLAVLLCGATPTVIDLTEGNYGFVREPNGVKITRSSLSSSAAGRQILTREFTAYNGGVVLQATAHYNEAECPLSLDYSTSADDGKRLLVSIGCSVAVFDATDEFIAPTVRLVEAAETSIVTLLGEANEPTDSERTALEQLNAKGDIYFLVQYQSAFENTLAGHLALVADTMLVSYERTPTITDSRLFATAAEVMRLSTSSLDPILQRVLPGVSFNPTNSERALQKINRMGAFVDSNGYMLTDLDLPYVLDRIGGRATVSGGAPYYLFWRDTTDSKYVETVSKIGTSEIYDLNPFVFESIKKISHLASLFRAVREQQPAAWQSFLDATRDLRVMQVRTAEFWRFPKKT